MVTFEQILNEMKEGATWVSGERTFWAEGTVNAEALRSDCG